MQGGHVFEQVRQRWRKQIGPLQGVSSSSCTYITHKCAVKKSSTPFPFRSCRVKQCFDSNWSGFQRQKRMLCLLTLNPLSAPHLFASALCFSPVCSCAHLHSPWFSISRVMAPKGSPVTLSFYLLPVWGICYTVGLLISSVVCVYFRHKYAINYCWLNALCELSWVASISLQCHFICENYFSLS